MGVGLVCVSATLHGPYNESRYLGFDPAIDQVVRSTAEAPARVGLAGHWVASEPSPIYPRSGPGCRTTWNTSAPSRTRAS